MDINTLINETLHSLLNDNHLRLSGIKRNYIPGFKFIADHYNGLGYDIVDDTFFTTCFETISVRRDSGDLSEYQFKRYRKCISTLRQYSIRGTTHYEYIGDLSFYVPLPQSEKILQLFLDVERQKLSETTVKSKGNIIRQFFHYLESSGQKDLANLTTSDISSFMENMATKRPAGLSTVVPAIRSFMSYLYKIGITQVDLSPSTSVKVIRRHRILGIFTPDEIERILKQINRNTPIGKRDFAIMLLSSRNGLRGSDILNLKLTDIYWKEAEIAIIQKKTSVAITCPIDVETGNALADYILNARPHSILSNVFLSVPHGRPFSSSGLCQRLKTYMNSAGIERTSIERIGMHTFRRSLGTTLLENGIALEMIAQILGQKNTDATKQYLSIAERELAKCALPMPHYSGLMEVNHG